MSAVCRLEDRRCELLQRRATNPSLKLSLSRLPGRLRPPRRRRVPFSGVTSTRPPRPHPPHWPSYLPKPAFSLLFSRLRWRALRTPSPRPSSRSSRSPRCVQSRVETRYTREARRRLRPSVRVGLASEAGLTTFRALPWSEVERCSRPAGCSVHDRVAFDWKGLSHRLPLGGAPMTSPPPSTARHQLAWRRPNSWPPFQVALPSRSVRLTSTLLPGWPTASSVLFFAASAAHPLSPRSSVVQDPAGRDGRPAARAVTCRTCSDVV